MRKGKARREVHAEITKVNILGAARTLFAERGYEAISLDEVAAAARVTKGAVYHHFPSKRDLFRTIYEELAGELEARVRRGLTRGRDPIARAEVALETFLDCADDVAIRGIMFRDGTRALGGECRTIDERHFLRLVRELLDELVANKLLYDADTAMVARLLLAVLIEGSQILAHSPHPRVARDALRTALHRMLCGLLGGTT